MPHCPPHAGDRGGERDWEAEKEATRRTGRGGAQAGKRCKARQLAGQGQRTSEGEAAEEKVRGPATLEQGPWWPSQGQTGVPVGCGQVRASLGTELVLASQSCEAEAAGRLELMPASLGR